VDRYSLETSRKKFYAGGDAISGASNVSNAMGYGKKAARNLDTRLMGVRRFDQIFPQFDYSQSPPVEMSAAPRHHSRLIPVANRKGSFAEVDIGLDSEMALAESGRCLRCDIREEH
jgi:NADPH-dependent glutamate synthase beta subunit-like oxidoreductase